MISEWLFPPITSEAEQNITITLTDLKCLGNVKFIPDPEEGVASDSLSFLKSVLDISSWTVLQRQQQWFNCIKRALEARPGFHLLKNLVFSRKKKIRIMLLSNVEERKII